jgi:hypothetical protein
MYPPRNNLEIRGDYVTNARAGSPVVRREAISLPENTHNGMHSMGNGIPALVGLVVVATGSAHANNGTVIGVGTDSCATFIRAIDAMRNDGSQKRAGMTWEGKQWVELGFSYEQWILGYISATNFAQVKQIVIDRDGIVLSVKKICEEYPDELLISGVSRFVAQQTVGRKGQKPPPP